VDGFALEVNVFAVPELEFAPEFVVGDEPPHPVANTHTSATADNSATGNLVM
jgi:hypothetical protein